MREHFLIWVTAGMLALLGWWFWFKADKFLHEPLFLAIASIGFTTFLLFQFTLATFIYQPAPDRNYTPTVSIIIPVKNEEKVIYESVKAASNSKYPKELLEIIVVNDGSTDNTREELRKAERDLGVKVLHFEKNMGKRKAVAAGFEKSTGEIVVVMDSDTILDPDAIYNGVQGFTDSQVGAVCGHGVVFNNHLNLLTKMQDAWYDGMFTIFKATESVFGMVTCCSGVLSFYRRKSIRGMIWAWASEKFLGVPLKVGDDRSLTNVVLRPRLNAADAADDRLLTTAVAKKGEKVVYARNAVAYTVVPSTFKHFIKQQIRWKKGWVRGTLVALPYMWRKHPVGAFLYYIHTYIHSSRF